MIKYYIGNMFHNKTYTALKILIPSGMGSNGDLGLKTVAMMVGE